MHPSASMLTYAAGGTYAKLQKVKITNGRA